ncbi:M60 family metallopeptidase [Streptomyces sp. NPDC054854]
MTSQNHDLGLSVGRVRSTDVELTWTPAPGQERYRVIRDGREIGSCSGQAFIDEEACPDTEYEYRVLPTEQAAGNAVAKVRTGPWPADAGDIRPLHARPLEPGEPLVLTLRGRPTSGEEKTRLALRTVAGSRYYSTGLYWPPGQDVSVEASGDLGPGRVLKLWAGAPYVVAPDGQSESPQPREHSALEAGANRRRDEAGGMLYVEYSAAPSDTVVVRLTGVEAAPYFVAGSTSQDDWLRMLRENSASPYAEIVSRRVIITCLRETMLQLAEEQTARGTAQEDVLRMLETVILLEDTYAGLSDEAGTAPEHRRSDLAEHFVHVPSTGSFIAATVNRCIKLHGSSVGWVTTLSQAAGWGLSHELGHHRQQFIWTQQALAEVTPNLFALHVQKVFGRPNRLVVDNRYEQAAAYLDGLHTASGQISAGPEATGAPASPWNGLVMLRQISLALGEEGWTRLFRMARENPEIPFARQEAAGTWRVIIYLLCRAFQHDLRDHFRAWGLSPVYDDAFHHRLDTLRLPTPSPAPTTRQER